MKSYPKKNNPPLNKYSSKIIRFKNWHILKTALIELIKLITQLVCLAKLIVDIVKILL